MNSCSCFCIFSLKFGRNPLLDSLLPNKPSFSEEEGSKIRFNDRKERAQGRKWTRKQI